MNAQFFGYVAFFTFAGIVFVLSSFLLSWMLRPWRARAEKLTTYECGEEPIGEGWHRYNVRYYLFALLFAIFEVACVFLFLWAVIFKRLTEAGMGRTIFWEMTIFLAILTLLLIYAWRKGNLEWV